MPAYTYKVKTSTGELITGTADGISREAVADMLFSKGYIPVKIEAGKKTTSASFELFGKVKSEDLIIFSRQLATLVKSGISFIRSLDTLEEQVQSKKLKSAIADIRKDIEGGSSFSEALAKFQNIFPPLYISMVKVGEESGLLDEILDRLATLLEHESTTKARIKAALRYPIIVVVSITIAFFVLTTFVVPKFAALYKGSKVPLPLPTKMLITTNLIITKYWYLILGIFGATVFATKAYIRTPSGRWNWDMLKLKIPIVGDIIHKGVMSRFARIFATLYRSGIPMLHALDIVSGTLGNVLISRAVDVIKEDVREGKGLTAPMIKTKVFTPIVVQMVAVGEETGALDDMLIKVSEYYDLEIEYAIKNLSTTIEPVLLVLLSGIILFMALGMFLPIWDMLNVMKR